MLSVEESKPFTYRINHFRCCVHRSVFSYVPCPSVYCGHLHVYTDTQSRSSSGRILPVPRIRPKIETEDCVLHLLSSRSYKASLLNVTTVAKFGQVHFYNLYIVTSIALGEILCIWFTWKKSFVFVLILVLKVIVSTSIQRSAIYLTKSPVLVCTQILLLHSSDIFEVILRFIIIFLKKVSYRYVLKSLNNTCKAICYFNGLWHWI